MVYTRNVSTDCAPPDMEKEEYCPPFSEELTVDKHLKLSFPNEKTLRKTVIDKSLQPNSDNLLREAIADLVGNTAKNPVTYDMNSVTTFPDLHTYALLASKAYKDTEQSMLLLPSGWKLLAIAANKSVTNGYFGAAFINPELHQIIIAHRGTKPLKFGAILTDVIGVLFNNMPAQMESAFTFAQKVGSIAMEIGKKLEINFQFFITGHSLGGWLAQITAFAMKYFDIVGANFQKAKCLSESIHAHTVAFDSPGCKPMLSKMKDKFDVRYIGRSSSTKALDIKTYLSAPNLINTCNAHVGTLYRLQMDFSDMTLLEKHTMVYTMAAHSMNRIVHALNPNNKPITNIVAVADWPIIILRKYVMKPIWKWMRYAAAICNATYDIPTSNDEDEWDSFFKFASNVNNYNPEEKTYESKESARKENGYWAIRYQTKPIDKQRCKINVFNQSEQEFIKMCYTIRNFRQSCRSIVSRSDVPENYRELLQNNLECFSIEEDYIICDHLHLFIPYIRQLLYWHTSILDATKEQLSDYGVKKATYHTENLRFLDSVKKHYLDYREGIELEFNSDHQVWQVIVKQTKDMRLMTAKIYFHCAKNFKDGADCTVLKLKQLLSIDQQYVRLKDFVRSPEMSSHLFIIECQQSEDLHDRVRELLGNSSGLMEKQQVRFIFIVKEGDRLTSFLQDEYKIALGYAFLTTKDTGTIWEDLAPLSQASLLQKKLIHFNGKKGKTSLEDLVSLPMEEFSDLIDCTTLNKLMKDEVIAVGKEPQSLRDWKAAFADIYELVSEDNFVEALLNCNDKTHFMISCLINVKDKDELLEKLKVHNDVEDHKRKIFLTVGQDAITNDKHWKELCCKYPTKIMYWVEITRSQNIQCKQIYNPEFYFERKFSLLDFTRIIRNEKNTNDLFVISHMTHDKEEVEKVKEQFNKCFVFVITEYQIQRHFNELRKYFKSVHWFRDHEKQCITWHCSIGSEDALQYFKPKEEYTNTVTTLDEASLVKLQDRVVIISGEPGMGKSTTLICLAEQMKSHWVILRDIRYCSHAIKSLPSDIAFTEDDAVNFLSMTKIGELESDLDKALLKCGLQGKTKRKLYLLFDGFDEINESEGEGFVKLLQFLKEHCACHIWITTRKHSKDHLESKLSVFAITLTEIGRQEQQEFLTKFWKIHLALKLNFDDDIDRKLSQYASKILDIADEILGPDKSSFMGVPLQLRMLAEAFPPNEELLTGLELEDIRIEIKDKCDLYETFVQRKYDIYFEEKVGITSSSGDAPKRWCTERLTQKHIFLALRMLFPSNADKCLCDCAAEDCENDVKDLNLVGLIQSEYSERSYDFIHRSFAEYFVVELIASCLKKPDGRHPRYQAVEEFLLSSILHTWECKGIRSFLNGMLTKSPLIHSACVELYKRRIAKMFSQGQGMEFTILCSSAFHVAADENLAKVIDILFASFKEFPESLENLISTRNNDGKTALYVAMENGNDNVVRQLLDLVTDCSVTTQKKLLWETLFWTHAEKDVVIGKIMEILENYHFSKKISQEIRNNWKQVPEFIRAISFGDIKKVENIINKYGRDDGSVFKKYLIASTDRHHKTALHIAAMRGQLEVVDWLLKEDANVNAKDHWDSTPLHMAVKRNHKHVAKVLLENNAEVNATDKAGSTALQLAKDKEIEELLIKYKAVMNPRQELDNMDLLFPDENPTVLPLSQVENDVNVEQGDDGGLLELAAETGHWHLVKQMIKQGASIKNLPTSHITNVLKYITGRLDTDNDIFRSQDKNKRKSPVPNAIGKVIRMNNVELLDIMIDELRKLNYVEQEYEFQTDSTKWSESMSKRLRQSPFTTDGEKPVIRKMKILI